MSDNKYYTPSIEEFYVGFEYEIKQLNDKRELVGWVKLIWSAMDVMEESFTITYEMGKVSKVEGSECYRVKYLDREDIEDFKWKPIYKENLWEKGLMLFHKEIKYRGEKHSCLIVYNSRSKWLVITVNDEKAIGFVGEKISKHLDFSVFGSVYAGNCNNSSQLKQILQWTGILK